MKLKEAIKITQHFQDWRIGKKNGMEYTGKQITEALNVVLEAANRQLRLED